MQSTQNPSNDNAVNQVFNGLLQDVSAHFRHAVAIDPNGAPYGWGDNSHGQLGLGDSRPSITKPTRIGTLTDMRSVACGQFHTLLVDVVGNLYGAGWTMYGALGNGQVGTASPPDVTTVTEIQGASVSGPWQAVQAKGFLSMGLRPDGSVWMWGKNDRGAVGIGTTDTQAVPVKVFDKAVQASVGWDLAAVIDPNGDIWIWGDNLSGQCSITSHAGLPYLTRPTKMISNGGRTWAQIAVGRTHVLAVDQQSGGLWAWGMGSVGQLGLGSGYTSVKGTALPVSLQAPANSRIVRIFAGDLASGAITQAPDGTTLLWMWGSDKAGRTSGRTDQQGVVWTPQIPSGTTSLTGVFSLALGDDFSLALNNPNGLPLPP